MAVLEIAKPALRAAIHVRDDCLQTLPIGAFGIGAQRVFELLETLRTRPFLASFEMVPKKVEATTLGGVDNARCRGLVELSP